MPGCNCGPACSAETPISPRYRKALWLALLINAAMFAVEIAAGMKSGSMSLFADALDFAGDAANYGISLAALAMGMAWRSRAAMVKGLSMLASACSCSSGRSWRPITAYRPNP